ncbi:MAG TPA: hypothetical protein VLY86_01525 [Methanothrix sp.]|nr:hypothetical protein [Methanothrix sp.]
MSDRRASIRRQARRREEDIEVNRQIFFDQPGEEPGLREKQVRSDPVAEEILQLDLDSAKNFMEYPHCIYSFTKVLPLGGRTSGDILRRCHDRAAFPLPSLEAYLQGSNLQHRGEGGEENDNSKKQAII